MEKLTKLQAAAKRAMIAAWPSGVVARTSAEPFSGGLVKAGSMAVFDCKGQGPERLTNSRKCMYLTESFADWLVRRFHEDHKSGKVGS